MDKSSKSTEYCSFVSVDYIICECGETFPNEDVLRDHLDTHHAQIKEEKPVETENLLQVYIDQSPVYVLQDDQVQNEYYLDDTPQTSDLEFILPDNVKQEHVVVQYLDEESGYMDSVGSETVIGEIAGLSESKPIGCKQVVFKKEQIAEEVVILDQENLEHDYDREAERPLKQEFYFCEVCGKSFMTEKSVKMHTQRMHVAGGGKRQTNKNSVCDVCGKKYAMWQRKCSGCGSRRKPSQPRRDPAKPKVEKQFFCDICGICRKSNAALRYHQRVHTGERPYKCSVCEKTFTMPLFLQLHIRTHTGERPYKCPHCPKAFCNQAALVRHDRVHTGVKPYACPECGKAFTQSNSMKLHYQTVHLKMPAPYKSAARKLKDANKTIIVLQEPTKNLKKERTEPYISPPRHKLMFCHKRPKYEYVIEETNYSDNEEYEDYILPVK